MNKFFLVSVVLLISVPLAGSVFTPDERQLLQTRGSELQDAAGVAGTFKRPTPLAVPIGEPQEAAFSCGPSWSPPVEAEVVDPFRPPENQFAAGNRGLEFGTSGGEEVSAVDQGEVVFAGPVGGAKFVVVLHPDALRSTYGYLDTLLVSAGELVSTGALLGYASTGFHLTARENGRYLDPQPLLQGCNGRVRLVQLPE